MDMSAEAKEKVAMSKEMVIAVALVVLWASDCAWPGVCEVVNGSFEDDGLIEDITVSEPNGWDPNIPVDKFGGYVDREWPTDGSFNLTLYSEYYADFDANDMATVSQQVYLTDVNQIIFDLKLETYYGDPWDPNKCTAVLLIDDDVVWESNSVGSDVRDEYYDQTYDVNEIYNDISVHKLSLGLRVNVSEELTDYYKAHWDFVRLGTYCGGFGLISGDINRDCYVDMNDLEMLVEVWLEEVGVNSKYNLFSYGDPNGIVDFLDFGVLAHNWMRSSYE